MAFNPKEHMMELKGREYLQVAWRLVWLRDEHPDWQISTECVECDDQHARFMAAIRTEAGQLIATAHGSETVRDFADYYEKAETKAVGRALAYCGYGTQFAGDELDEGERMADTPIERKKAEIRTASPKQVEILAQYYTDANLARLLGENGVARLEDLPMEKASELIGKIAKIRERREAQ